MPEVLDSGVIIRPVPCDVGYVVSFRQKPCGIMTSLPVTMTLYPALGNMQVTTLWEGNVGKDVVHVPNQF